MHVKDFLLWKTTQVFSYFSKGTPLAVLGYLSNLLFFSCVTSILLPQLIKLISLLHLDGWFTINESPSSIVRFVILLVTNPKSSSAVMQWSMQEFYLPHLKSCADLAKLYLMLFQCIYAMKILHDVLLEVTCVINTIKRLEIHLNISFKQITFLCFRLASTNWLWAQSSKEAATPVSQSETQEKKITKLIVKHYPYNRKHCATSTQMMTN